MCSLSATMTVVQKWNLMIDQQHNSHNAHKHLAHLLSYNLYYHISLFLFFQLQRRIMPVAFSTMARTCRYWKRMPGSHEDDRRCGIGKFLAVLLKIAGTLYYALSGVWKFLKSLPTLLPWYITYWECVWNKYTCTNKHIFVFHINLWCYN